MATMRGFRQSMTCRSSINGDGYSLLVKALYSSAIIKHVPVRQRQQLALPLPSHRRQRQQGFIIEQRHDYGMASKVSCRIAASYTLGILTLRPIPLLSLQRPVLRLDERIQKTHWARGRDALVVSLFGLCILLGGGVQLHASSRDQKTLLMPLSSTSQTHGGTLSEFFADDNNNDNDDKKDDSNGNDDDDDEKASKRNAFNRNSLESNDNDIQQLFFDACFAGDVCRVRELLEKGANPRARHPHMDSDTALHRAVRGRNVEMVKFLLQQGGPLDKNDLNVWNHRGLSPLHCAVYTKQLDMVRLLIQHGADPQIGTFHRKSTPLHLACLCRCTEILEFLLMEKRLDANPVDFKGQTPLEYAIKCPHADAVRLLIDFGAKTNGIRIFGPLRREDNVLLRQAKQRRRKAQAFMDVHGWRALAEAAIDDIEASSSIANKGATREPNKKARQVAFHRSLRMKHLQKQLHEIDTKLQVAGYDLPLHEQQRLVQVRTELREKLVLLCQSNDIDWRRRKRPRTTPDVFISHAGSDPISAALSEVVWESLLKNHAIDAFLDSESIKTGDAWRQEIEFCATGCDIFVCILSEPYFCRYWCMHELDMALRSGRRVIPICFDKESFQFPDVNDTFHHANLSAEIDRKQDVFDQERLHRWCSNLRELKGRQIKYNEHVAKHKFTTFRDEVVTVILDNLRNDEKR